MSEVTGGAEAIAEASVDSLAELFSRDPEKLSEIDLTRLVENLREQRVRWAAQEALPKAAKTKTVAGKAASLISASKPEDLGL